ncbi:hypothetical protein [Streptomyces silvensis]|uniref:hypothetical protein n=1 Tax=Streptomyces silvensis TaxID=1765722 RepID=UPI000A59BDF1|nr:hypothetical protein [Streptomyces silvensis]
MSDFDRQARRARLRLAGIGVLAAGVLVTGGVIAVNALGGDDGNESDTRTGASPTSTNSPAVHQTRTPATARRLDLSAYGPDSTSKGIGTGFEHSAMGATAAAVSYWENLDLLDDVIARRQWTAIASKDSPEAIERGTSEVRKLREGAGLPPSGGTPDGITFTTSVNAVLQRSLDNSGEVVNVWMSYDRYATVRNKGGDDDPLKNETTNLVLKWEDGDWKVTEEQKYTERVRGPRAYHPDSRWAYMDGWRELADA